MPKLKTNKAARKRFKITGTRKVTGARVKRRHLFSDRSPGKKRRFRKEMTLAKANQDAVLKQLPYG
jgi:large subunit ribosomal protein L35